MITKKLQKTVLWAYVIEELNGEEIVGGFYEKKNQKDISVGKVKATIILKRKVYDNS